MTNIIKSQNRQLLRDKFTIMTLLVGMIAHIFFMTLNHSGISEMKGGMFTASIFGYIINILMIIILLIGGRAAGWDFSDKTINYEIMSGHSRKEIFAARTFIAMFWCILIYMVLVILPAGIFTIIKGWGVYVSISEVLLRFAISIFPVIRLVCFVVFLTFVMADGFKAMLVGYALLMFGSIGLSIIEELADIHLKYGFATSNAASVLDMSNYVYKMVDNEEQMVLNSTLSAEVMIKTIVISLVVSVVYLLLGYMSFKKKDL